jgi:hypothetical protein
LPVCGFLHRHRQIFTGTVISDAGIKVLSDAATRDNPVWQTDAAYQAFR